MYIKGCENSTTHESEQARQAYREGWNRIWGKKNQDDIGTINFPSGEGIYCEEDGKWYDKKEYKASNYREHKPTVLLQFDNPTPLEYTKHTKSGGTEKTMMFKKIYK